MLAAADVHVALRLARLADGRRRAGRCSRPRSPCAHPGSAPSASTSPRSATTATVDADEPVDLSALPWPARGDGSNGSRRARSSPSARTAARADRSGSSAPRSTSTATGATSATSPPTSSPSAPRPPTTSTTAVLADGLARLFPDGDDRPPAPRRRDRACCAASPSSPAAPAPARRPPSRASSCCSTSRPRRPAAPTPLVALAAPTGKAAARLEEAVHEEAAGLDVERRRPRATARRRGVDPPPAARLAPGQRQPLPARPPQPTAARRRHRRRDLDGVALADGAPARGGAAGRAADPRRRPRAARLGRGRRRARRPRRPRRRRADARRRARSPGRRQTVPRRAAGGVAIGDGSSSSPRPPLRGAIADWPRRPRGDADARSPSCGRTTTCRGSTSTSPTPSASARPVREAAVAAGRTVIDAARAGDAPRRSPRSAGFRLLCAHRRGPYGVATWNAGSRAGSRTSSTASPRTPGTSAGRCS